MVAAAGCAGCSPVIEDVLGFAEPDCSGLGADVRSFCAKQGDQPTLIHTKARSADLNGLGMNYLTLTSLVLSNQITKGDPLPRLFAPSRKQRPHHAPGMI